MSNLILSVLFCFFAGQIAGYAYSFADKSSSLRNQLNLIFRTPLNLKCTLLIVLVAYFLLLSGKRTNLLPDSKLYYSTRLVRLVGSPAPRGV